jgi:geranylgeranyl reductase family protein
MGDYRRKNDYDAIVVGLGPAGANAAYHLGCAGINTLAIEKKVLPRRKACAGGIPAKVVDLLDFDFSAAIEQEIKSAVVNFRQIKSIEMDRNDNLGYVVNRPIFDHLLALRAEKAGVRISQGESVHKVSERNRLIEVRTNRDTYHCRALIGADGAQGMTASVLGCSSRPASIGLEVYVPYKHDVIRNHTNKLGFYFGYLPAGYGWIFPLREHASVGICIPMKYARRTRSLLADFLESLGLFRGLAAGARGHALPLYSPLTRRYFCRRNILLAGDAASFVDPVTGEGIYYALRSGKEAAGAISETLGTSEQAARIYAAALKSHILPELRAAWKVSLPLNAFPEESFNFFQANDRIRKMQLDVITGRSSYVELIKQVPPVTLVLIKSLFSRLIPGKHLFIQR